MRVLLIIISGFLFATHTFSAPPRLGWLTKVRTDISRVVIVRTWQELAMAELDATTAEKIQKININLFSYTKSIPPLAQVKMILHEYDAKIGALLGRRLEVEEALHKISALIKPALIMDEDTEGVKSVAGDYQTVEHYHNRVYDLVEGKVGLLLDGRDSMYMIALGRELLEKKGITMKSLLERGEMRKKTGWKDLAKALKELSELDNSLVPHPVAGEMADRFGFRAEIVVRARTIVPSLGEMVPLGIEAKAKIYEYGARVAAMQRRGDIVRANLSRILNLNSMIDRVMLTVNTKIEQDKTLTTENIEKIKNLYLRVFAMHFGKSSSNL